MLLILFKKKGLAVWVSYVLLACFTLAPTLSYEDFMGINPNSLTVENNQKIILNSTLSKSFEDSMGQYREDPANSNTKVAKRHVRSVSRGSSNRNLFLPFEKTGFSPEQFNEMLGGTGLAGSGICFYEIEQAYDVNGLFAIGVAMHESALGFKTFRKNNYFGMVGMEFSSKHENIMYFGELLSGSKYKGCGKTTIEQIHARYAAGPTWAARVRMHMLERLSKLKTK